MERWESLEAHGFPNYTISDQGEVKNARTGNTLKLSPNQYHVVRVGLMRPDQGKQVTLSLARLVALTFVSGKSAQFNTPINMNGDRNDNRASNLAWRPRWFAVKFNEQFEESKEPYLRTKIYDVETGKHYADSREAACDNGLLEEDIMQSVVSGKPCFPTWQIFARASQ